MAIKRKELSTHLAFQDNQIALVEERKFLLSEELQVIIVEGMIESENHHHFVTPNEIIESCNNHQRIISLDQWLVESYNGEIRLSPPEPYDQS